MARVSGASDETGALRALGAAVRAKRISVGMSQEALADAAGVDRSHMGKIERGERNVTLLNLVRIAAALGLPLSDLSSRAGL